MPPDPARTAEALLSQSDWVRALVRGLGVDESGAEDVLQSTWIAALTKPPRTAGENASFRAWIGRVARNFALRRIDRDARRAGRERATARDERLPSASDVVEREEARAEVVRALLDVHEPFRTALLLRFYEGLEPRDIARLQGVPDSTVRNRLKRGLALLRERLEATQGPNWRQRCLLVLPALRAPSVGIPKPSKPVAANAAPGGAVVIKSLGIATLTAALAGGVYFAWHRDGGERDLRAPSERLSRSSSSSASSAAATSPSSGTSTERAHRAGAAPQLVASVPESTRAPVANAPQEAGALADADDGHRCTLRGRVMNPDGTPIRSGDLEPIRLSGTVSSDDASGEEMFAVGFGTGSPAPAGRALHEELKRRVVDKAAAEADEVERVHAERALTEERSSLEKELAARGAIAPAPPAPKGPEGAAAIRVDAGETSQVLMEKFARLQDLTYGFAIGVAPRPTHVVIASKAGDAREMDVDGDGSFEFADLRPGAWHLFATAAGRLARRMDFEIGPAETGKSLDVTLEPSKQLKVKLSTPDGADLLEAVAKDPNLAEGFQPIPFATRSAPGPRTPDLQTDPERRFACGSWRGREQVDEKTAGDASGILELSDELPLHVGVSVRGVVVEERAVQPGTDEVVFVVPLEKIRAIASGVTLRLVSGSDGHPIAGAWVDVAEFPGATTSEDGSVEIASLAPGLRMLRYGADGMERRCEWTRVEPGKRTDLGVRELDPATPIHGRILDENGSPVQVIALLRDLDGATAGRELAICDKAGTDAEGRFTFRKAGRRRYAVTIEGGDWVAPLQTIDARPGSPAEVLMHARHSPAELKLTFPVEPPPGASYVVETTDGIPVVVQTADGWRQLAARLGDGSYRVRLVSDGRTLWARNVVIEPGRMMALDGGGSGR